MDSFGESKQSTVDYEQLFHDLIKLEEQGPPGKSKNDVVVSKHLLSFEGFVSYGSLIRLPSQSLNHPATQEFPYLPHSTPLQSTATDPQM